MSLRPRGVGGRVLKKDEQPPPPQPPKPPKPILVEGPQPRVRGKFVRKARVKPAPPPPPIEPGSRYITHRTLGDIDSNIIFEAREDLNIRFLHPSAIEEIARPILDKIQELRRDKSFKLQIIYHIQATKPDTGKTDGWAIRSKASDCIVLPGTSREQLWQEIIRIMNNLAYMTEEYTTRGSNWIVDYLIKLEVNLIKYDPLRAGSYKPLPTWLSKKRAIQNIQNTDDMCFKTEW
jgi:hypothetical protein